MTGGRGSPSTGGGPSGGTRVAAWTATPLTARAQRTTREKTSFQYFVTNTPDRRHSPDTERRSCDGGNEARDAITAVKRRQGSSVTGGTVPGAARAMQAFDAELIADRSETFPLLASPTPRK